MRVLIIHQFYTGEGEAGISRFNVFGKYWREDGVEMEVVSGRVNYFTGERMRVQEEPGKEGAHIRRVWSSDLGFGYRTFVGRMCSYLSFTVGAFATGLVVARPDAVVASSPPISVGLVAALVAAVRRVPFVFEVRDMWPDDAIELGFIKNPFLVNMSRLLERFLYRRAVLVVTNSPGIKDWLVTKKRLPAGAVGVVENPVEIRMSEERERMRKKLGWEGKTVLVYMGSHSFVYDFELVLDAAKILEKELVLFAFVGDGRQKPQIARRVEKERVTNVVMLPPVSASEVPKYLAAADIGFAALKKFPRLRAVYATKVFDYMAAGLPTVLAMEGVTKELLTAANAGICVAPGDTAAFVTAIRTFSADEKRKEAFGVNGKKFIDTHYRARDLARRYLKLLEPLVVPE